MTEATVVILFNSGEIYEIYYKKTLTTIVVCTLLWINYF